MIRRLGVAFAVLVAGCGSSGDSDDTHATVEILGVGVYAVALASHDADGLLVEQLDAEAPSAHEIRVPSGGMVTLFWEQYRNDELVHGARTLTGIRPGDTLVFNTFFLFSFLSDIGVKYDVTLPGDVAGATTYGVCVRTQCPGGQSGAETYQSVVPYELMRGRTGVGVAGFARNGAQLVAHTFMPDVPIEDTAVTLPAWQTGTTAVPVSVTNIPPTVNTPLVTVLATVDRQDTQIGGQVVGDNSGATTFAPTLTLTAEPWDSGRVFAEVRDDPPGGTLFQHTRVEHYGNTPAALAAVDLSASFGFLPVATADLSNPDRPVVDWGPGVPAEAVALVASADAWTIVAANTGQTSIQFPELPADKSFWRPSAGPAMIGAVTDSGAPDFRAYVTSEPFVTRLAGTRTSAVTATDAFPFNFP